MKNIQFDPKEITVKVGEKVTWTNDESVSHDVAATKGASFKSDMFGEGGTFAFTPTKAGHDQLRVHAAPRHGRDDRGHELERPPPGGLMRSRATCAADAPRSPKPRAISSARSPSPPCAGSTPSCCPAS